MPTVEETLVRIAEAMEHKCDQIDAQVRRNEQHRAENLQMREEDVRRIKAEHAEASRQNCELIERLDIAIDLITRRVAALESRFAVGAVDPHAGGTTE